MTCVANVGHSHHVSSNMQLTSSRLSLILHRERPEDDLGRQVAADRTRLAAVTNMTDGALRLAAIALVATVIGMATVIEALVVTTTKIALQAIALRHAVALWMTILLLAAATKTPTAVTTRPLTRIRTVGRMTGLRRGTTRRVSLGIHERVPTLRASSIVAIGNSSPLPEPARFLT